MDFQDGDGYFYGSPVASSDVVGAYLVDVARILEQKGDKQATILLDRHSTHQAKMNAHFQTLSAQAGLFIQVAFVHFAAYSPWMNVVEYAIHLLGQQPLHHRHHEQDLAALEARLDTYLAAHRLLTPEQIVNTMGHIEHLLKERLKKVNL